MLYGTDGAARFNLIDISAATMLYERDKRRH
jgi:hypothetical protein